MHCGGIVVIVALIVSASPLPARAQELGSTPPSAPEMHTPNPTQPAAAEAPFGLEWLASKQAITAAGIELGSQMATEFGESYVVSRLPKELADQHYAVLSFGDDDRLIRITAIGRPFTTDYTGNQVQARYAELQDLLRKKYGPGKAESHVEKNYDGTNWAVGLQTKRNWMHTVFTAGDLAVELSVFCSSAPQTQWRIIFEYAPEMERLERRRREKEEKAL